MTQPIASEVLDSPTIDWQVLIDLANDISSGDATVDSRVRLAASDGDAFIQLFVDEEPEVAGQFILGLDGGGDQAPLLHFAAIMTASGNLAQVDWKYPLSDIVSIFNDHAEGLGLHRLDGQEVAELEALAPKDERQTDVFFHDVASDLDRMCVARRRRLLCWDEGSDAYGWFVVTPDCFDKWVGTTLGQYHKLDDAERFA